MMGLEKSKCCNFELALSELPKAQADDTHIKVCWFLLWIVSSSRCCAMVTGVNCPSPALALQTWMPCRPQRLKCAKVTLSSRVADAEDGLDAASIWWIVAEKPANGAENRWGRDGQAAAAQCLHDVAFTSYARCRTWPPP